METIGYRGGIWLLWSSDVQIKILANFLQFVHVQVTNAKKNIFFLTCVYASPSSPVRKLLWHQLSNIQLMVGIHPWIMGGDFNAHLNKEDKKGGVISGLPPCTLFNKWFN